MPQKPKPTRVNRAGQVVPNELATAANGALNERSAQRRDFAIATELADIESGQPTKGRYSRVRTAIIAHFACSRSEAERAIARAKVYLAERFDEELPTRRARVCEQLQRIADEQEQEQPIAAVAALREQARILGLYAPKKLEVTHGVKVERDLQIDAALHLLSPQGRAAFDLLMAELAELEASGRLALPGGDDDPDRPDADPEEDVQDAVLIGDDDPAGGPGRAN